LEVSQVSPVPDQPSIYHITHIDNLTRIVEHGTLWSDARRLEEDCQCTIIGMSKIKQRRLQEIEVTCHPGTRVGQYAPFYFCPRSIMLYVLHRSNLLDLDYCEGQEPIIHFQADLGSVIEWAEKDGRPWAFTDGNAGSYCAAFYNDLANLEVIDWNAIAATDWRDPLVKEAKQAEFLVLDSFPWDLVQKVGVIDRRTLDRVSRIIENAPHKPLVSVQRDWYY
jgi:ssDNA thymidine ADP-ribosyltransferase, DarT